MEASPEMIAWKSRPARMPDMSLVVVPLGVSEQARITREIRQRQLGGTVSLLDQAAVELIGKARVQVVDAQLEQLARIGPERDHLPVTVVADDLPGDARAVFQLERVARLSQGRDQ